MLPFAVLPFVESLLPPLRVTTPALWPLCGKVLWKWNYGLGEKSHHAPLNVVMGTGFSPRRIVGRGREEGDGSLEKYSQHFSPKEESLNKIVKQSKARRTLSIEGRNNLGPFHKFSQPLFIVRLNE